MIYSCVGFIILGMMLEEVSGSDLERLFRNRVLVPAGLENDLGFNPDSTLRTRWPEEPRGLWPNSAWCWISVSIRGGSRP